MEKLVVRNTQTVWSGYLSFSTGGQKSRSAPQYFFMLRMIITWAGNVFTHATYRLSAIGGSFNFLPELQGDWPASTFWRRQVMSQSDHFAASFAVRGILLLFFHSNRNLPNFPSTKKLCSRDNPSWWCGVTLTGAKCHGIFKPWETSLNNKWSHFIFFCLVFFAEVFVRLGQWCLVLSGLWNDWQHAPRSLERDL